MSEQPPNYPPPPPPPGGYGYEPPPPPPGGYGYEPPPPPGGYGYPPPAPGGYGYSDYPTHQATGTNGMAIASLVCSLVGLVCMFVGPLLGVVLGFVALNQIKQSGQEGRGLAIAGIVVGGVLIAFHALLLIVGVLAPDHDHTGSYDRSAPATLVRNAGEQPASLGLVSLR